MVKTPIPKVAPLHSRTDLQDHYHAVIAIPCCNEHESLPLTLRSLENVEGPERDQTLVIVNVNQRATMDRGENLTTLKWLSDFETPLHLAWLDHVTGDAAYPEKFGVGLARHQACIHGANLIDDPSPIISLDADSPVNREYLSAIFDYLGRNPDFKAGHVNFKHQSCGGETEGQAIRIYEQHLHEHRSRLQEAGSPHAWYAIGSTIVCTKQAYLRSGGYHGRRLAGEDFYLLQQLSKTGCAIEFIEKAFVYPSDRVSDRVPFGTGKAVGDILRTGIWNSYHPHCYQDLGRLLATIEANPGQPAEALLRQMPLGCVEWLQGRDFSRVWPRLQNNARDDAMLLTRFHEWLDAFQTLKLIHFLSTHYYPRIEVRLPS